MTNKFIGTKCIVCSEIFAEGDDIVVCPQCGTPYHRDCWQENGECVNHELHEHGGSWTPHIGTEKAQTTQELRCPRCGRENQPGRFFCEECGMQLSDDTAEERPFNQTHEREQDSFNNAQNGGTNSFRQYQGEDPQKGFDFSGPGGQNGSQQRRTGPSATINAIRLTPESDMNGIRLGDFFDYIGKKSFSLITSFVRFAKTNAKTSFNVFAFIFPEYYFFYRKMNKKGIIFLAISFILAIPQMIYIGQSGDYGTVFFKTSIDLNSEKFLMIYNLCSMLSLTANVIAGLFANWWYYNQARRDIEEIRRDESSAVNAAALIGKKGGISWKGAMGGFLASVILTLTFILAMSLMFGMG